MMESPDFYRGYEEGYADGYTRGAYLTIPLPRFLRFLSNSHRKDELLALRARTATNVRATWDETSEEYA